MRYNPINEIQRQAERNTDISVLVPSSSSRVAGTPIEAGTNQSTGTLDWVPYSRLAIDKLGSFILSSRSVTVGTTRYGFIDGKVNGDDLGAPEVNPLGDGLELAMILMSDILGQHGYLTPGDFNASVIAASRALNVTRGSVLIGTSADWVFHHQDTNFTLNEADIVSGTPYTNNVLHYFWQRKSDGLFQVNTTGTQPANTELAFTATMNAGGTEFSSANSNPTGRSNLDTLSSVLGLAEGTRQRTITANRTLDATDEFVFVDTSAGAVTITLPAAAGWLARNGTPKRPFVIKKTTTDGNNVVVQRSGADTVDGATSHTWATANGSFRYIANGAGQWRII